MLALGWQTAPYGRGQGRVIRYLNFSFPNRIFLSLQWNAPWWRVAVSTMRRQSVRSLAFLQVEWIPMLTDCTSELIPLSQVERGHPQGLLQWLGGRSDTSITRWWFYWKSACATCPKKQIRLSNNLGDWTTASGLPDGSVGNMSGIWYPNTMNHIFIW